MKIDMNITGGNNMVIQDGGLISTQITWRISLE